MKTARGVLTLIALGAASAAWAQSDAESPCPEPQAHQFDFWEGAWEVENLQRNTADPSDPKFYSMGTSQVEVMPVAGGCGMAELWHGDLNWGTVRRFSLRAWDPETEQWHTAVNWVLPEQPVAHYITLEGMFEHGRADLFMEQENAEGTSILTRYTYADITEDRYRWDAATSTDGGVTWKPSWIQQATALDDASIAPGTPSHAVPESPVCPEPDHRELDEMLGTWQGTDKNTDEPVRVDVQEILDGCGIIEQWQVGDDRRFRVRAWDLGENRWVAFGVSAEDRSLREYLGAKGQGPVFFYRQDGTLYKEKWRVRGKKRIFLEEISQDGGESWETGLEVKLEKAEE